MKSKKSPTIWALGPGAVPYGKYGAGYCITFIKSLDENLRLQFLGQIPLISPWLFFKLVGKYWIKGVRWPSGRQYYLLLITVVRVYCCTYAKMLKETENEETRFFVKFLSLVAFQLKGPGPPGPPPWLRLWFWNKIAPLSSFIKKIFKAKLK